MSPDNSALTSAQMPPRLADDYMPPAGVFDEMCTSAGEMRPHWEYLLKVIQALGPTGIAERRREARRLIRDKRGHLQRLRRYSGHYTVLEPRLDPAVDPQ